MKLYMTVVLSLACLCDLCPGEDTCPPAPPEFQFPCYVDVCTFPRHYCNSDPDVRRCSPCTRRICDDDKVPQACKYYCRKYERPTTTAPIPTVVSAGDVMESRATYAKDGSNMNIMYLMLGYLAIAFTLLVIVVIFVACLVYFRRGRRQPGDKALLQPRSFRSVTEGATMAETTGLLGDVVVRLSDCRYCPTCGRENAGMEHETSLMTTYAADEVRPAVSKTSSNLVVSVKDASDRSSDPTPASTPESGDGTCIARTPHPSGIQQGANGNVYEQVSRTYQTNPTNDFGESGQHEKPWELLKVDMKQQEKHFNMYEQKQATQSNNLTAPQTRDPARVATNYEQHVGTDTPPDRRNSFTAAKSNDYLEQRHNNNVADDSHMASAVESHDTRSVNVARRPLDTDHTRTAELGNEEYDLYPDIDLTMSLGLDHEGVGSEPAVDGEGRVHHVDCARSRSPTRTGTATNSNTAVSYHRPYTSEP